MEDASPRAGRHESGYAIGRVLYRNPLSTTRDVEGFRLEGEATIDFPDGRMRMSSKRDPREGQAANFVF